MIHIGETEFYRAVYDDAFAHDVVLVEGVRSPITTRVTRAYRWMAGSKRLGGLVVQPRAPALEERHARVVHADLSGEEFARVWKSVPFWLRALIYVAAPIFALRYRWFGTREMLAHSLSSLDDAPSMKELLSWTPERALFDKAVLEARDKRLVDTLGKELDNPRAGETRLAIVYGAGHMRAVLRELTGVRGFLPDHGEWLTVFRPWDPAGA